MDLQCTVLTVYCTYSEGSLGLYTALVLQGTCECNSGPILLQADLDKMRRFKSECAHFSFNKCPFYTHNSASAKIWL